MSKEILVTREIKPTDLTKDGIVIVLSEIDKEVKSVVCDVTTPSGRKDIASLAYKIARTKTAIDDAGKNIAEEWKKKVAVVDEARKIARDHLDSLKERVRRPLTEFEEAEEKRVKERQERILEIESLKSICSGSPQNRVDMLERNINRVQNLVAFDWQEFDFKAKTIANLTIDILNQQLTEAREQIAKDLELEKLRAEAAERAKKDHEEKIAKEAAERAKKEAEEAAKRREAQIEAEKKRAEEAAKQSEENRKRLEQEKIAAEKRAIETEKLRKEQEENYERLKVEAEKKAKEEIARLGLEAEKAAQKAIEEKQEKDRQETEKREANKKHCEKINREATEIIQDVIIEIGLDHGSNIIANKIVLAIAEGKVPHISIKY